MTAGLRPCCGWLWRLRSCFLDDTCKGKKQIPSGNDRKKSQGNDKNRNRFFSFGKLRVRMTIPNDTNDDALGDELFFQVELLGGSVACGVEVGAAAGFVEAGGAYDDEFLRLA
jgi:hypothetical protein